MLHRASIVPITLTLAVAVGACNVSPGNTDTTVTNGDSTFTTDGPSSTGDSTEAPPTSSEPTTAGPTTQTDPGTDTTDPEDDNTIYQVQLGDIPIDAVVTIKGVIVTSPMKLDDKAKGAVFVQEPDSGEYSGIQLYLYEEVAAAWDAPPGTIVDITGTYTEFYDNSQLTIKAPGDVTIVGPGEVPAPIVVAAADVATDGAKAENYEGVLVQLNDAAVTATGIGQFTVEGGAIVTDFFIYPPDPLDAQIGDVYASIVGPLLYSFKEFKVAPRTLADLDGGGDTTGTGSDTDTDTGDTSTGDNAVTIYDVQQGMFPENAVVTLEGVIATSGLTFKKDGFFIQEPAGGEHSGIFVYINMLALNIAPGDELTITGTYVEFYENSQITVSNLADVTITGSVPVPAPEVLAPADIATGGPLAENYEGVLVQVNNVDVTAPVDMFGQFQVEGVLEIDDLFIAKVDWVNPMIGDNYASIAGPLAYNYDEFKISPTKPADLKP